MCGILGSVSKAKNQKLVEKAALMQSHRGPDAQDISFYDATPWNLYFAHQRLSIIDLTAAANQPFSDDQYSLIYNGEIYNYIELRQSLQQQGVHFKTNSDTEVVFECLKLWGIEKAVQSFNGFWAIAFFNKRKNNLFLSRDRFGIKPLYYYLNEEQLYFASEIKSILTLTERKHSLNKAILSSYIEQHLIDANNEQTFFTDIQKLPPGHNGFVDLTKDKLSLVLHSFYELKPDPQFQNIGTQEAKILLTEKLKKSIQLRLRSDVPVGVLLSGGLDSSCIAAVADSELKEKTKLLSYVSDNKDVDESQFIDIMATYLNREVIKVRIDIQPLEALELLKKVTYFNDQPLHSFAAVAHFLLMEQAKKQNITVILSGQGADETLCGYRKYTLFYLKSLIFRSQFSRAILFLFHNLTHGEMIRGFSIKDAKRYLPNFLNNRSKSILSVSLKKHYQALPIGIMKKESLIERQIRDIKQFSVPSLLHYEDRMSMAHAREIRVPFLDHNLVEFLISLPTSLKLFHGWTKYILRLASEPFLPKAIAWRKDKKGFSNPQANWLRDELRKPLVECFSSDQSLIYELDLIDKTELLNKYESFCKNPQSKISEREIFAPFALNLWLELFINSIDTES